MFRIQTKSFLNDFKNVNCFTKKSTHKEATNLDRITVKKLPVSAKFSSCGCQRDFY